jgi:transposase-like protein
MDDSIRQLRVQARQLAHGKVPRAVRYPVAFRAAALALARPRLSRGVPIARVARDLGLSTQCLDRWLRAQPSPGPIRRVAVVPMPVAAARPPAGLVLLTPRGHRVEGLDRDGLIAVLRALA